jgi:superoxide dismutase, Fe-Mn family
MNKTTRREWLRHGLMMVGGAVVAGTGGGTSAWAQASDASKGPFAVEPLGYAFDALEPSLDARTMEIHHDKHYAGYVKNLNAAVVATPALAGKTLEALLAGLKDLPEHVQTTVRNNGGGAANHALFWKLMAPAGQGGKPSAALEKAIDAAFGSFDKFKDNFSGAALSRFGSGWAWIHLNRDRGLELTSTANQDTPLMEGKTPLLGLDVWEHAYYLKYQNRRADYIKAWWDIVNWDFISARYEELTKTGQAI